MPVVLGYHGCTKQAAQHLLGGAPFQPSEKDYDWLGHGAYFWENDPQRAFEWAQQRRSHSPCVVGAAIELGHCLDLTTRRGTSIVRSAYENYRDLQIERKQALPRNLPLADSKLGDLVIRNLDKAVIDHLHSIYKSESARSSGKTQEFDTVRALFPEGRALYENAGFWEKTHIQIAVRQEKQVLGVFRVPAFQLRDFNIPDDVYSF